MKTFNLSLRAKLIGLVGSAVILLTVGTVFNLNQFEAAYEHRIVNQMVTAAIKLGKSITAQLWERYSDVQAFAANKNISSLNKDLMGADLDQYIKLYSIYDLILVIDKNGKLVASNSESFDGKKISFEKLKNLNFSKEPWFENALNGRFTEDAKNGYKGTYVESFLLNNFATEAYGEKKYGSIFSTQIKDSKGEVIGVIANHAGSRWLEFDLADQHNQMVEEELLTSEVMMFNSDGKVMIHSDVVEGTKSIAFETDDKVILNHSFDVFHEGLGDIVKSQPSGFSEMVHKEKNLVDLVAYHKIDNKKSLAALGWTVLVEDTAGDAYAATTKSKMQSYIILAVMSFFGLLLATWAGIIISKSVAKVTATLAVNSEEVADASQKIASSSTELSETATQQAAALQETVAAIDEISAMVDRNAESAQKSKDVSNQSRETANRGRETVSTMILAIQDIDRSNDEINQQMEESNRQLQEITKLINDIRNKTTIINEIVFQTKLLSFNASVEAARAGEAGKGFAVVAEEVGNLAQMSGNAAKEISTLLEQSVQKVNAIVGESKEKVERLMQASKEKVNRGSVTAQDCNSSLDEIIGQIQTVDSLVSEIAVASQEQSTGIREVSRAMGQMETATQQNSAVASATSSAGEQLRAQSEILNTLVKDLSFIVTGQANGNGPQQALPKKSVVKHKEESVNNNQTNAKAKESSSKVGTVLNFVTGKKDKNGQKEKNKSLSSTALSSSEAINPAIAKMTEFKAKTQKPVEQKPPKAQKAEPVEKVAAVSGADFVPSGDDPGFSE